MIHLYYFDEYHRQANLYKRRILHNFKCLNYFQNLLLCVFEIAVTIIFNKSEYDNYPNYERKIIFNLLIINMFVFISALFFIPPKAHLTDRYYLRRSLSSVFLN